MKTLFRSSSVPSRLQRAGRLVAAVALTLAVGRAGAATDTWVGNTSLNWNDLNWSGGNNPPLGGDAFLFGLTGALGPLLNNDLPLDTSIAGMTFVGGASAFSMGGNEISLTGNVVNNSTSLETLSMPILLPAQRVFTTVTGGGNLLLSGVLSGAGGVSKTGVGTLTLASSASTYIGETIFGTGGIVNVASLSDYGLPSAIGARGLGNENNSATGVSLHFQGGTLQYTGSTAQSTNREIRILGGGTIPGVNNFIDASGTTPDATLSFTHTGPNINLYDTSGHRTLTLTGTNTGANSFSIRLTDQAFNAVTPASSTGLTTLQKTGAGTWKILNVDNTYAGETIIGGGILNVASISDYGVASSIGARTLANEGTTSTGVGLHFRGGTLQYTGSTPQSTNRHIRILNGNGGTIDASGTDPGATFSFTRTGTNMNLFDTGGVRTFTLTGTNTGNNTFSIPLTDQALSATSLAKTGVGTWVLNGPDANSITGSTSVSGGTLVLAKTNVLAVSGALSIGNGSARAVVQLGGTGGNQISNAAVVSFSGAEPTAGVLRMAGLDETVAGISSGGGGGIVENESGVAGTATLTVSNTANQSYSGILRDGDGVGTDGALALTKSGPGTLFFSGTSTHTGPTRVTAGVLTVDGTLSAGSTTTVTNATLNGAGTIAGPVTVSTGGVINPTGTVSGTVTLGTGGTFSGAGTISGTVNAQSGSHIAPGGTGTMGTLNVGTLNLFSGALLDFELDPAVGDLINVTGALALNGGSFNLFAAGGGSALMTNGTYPLLDYSGSFTGSLANLSIANSQVGKFYSIADDKTNTVLTLTVGDSTVTEWNGSAADGKWTTAGNWGGGVPNAAGAVARFGALPATPSTVTLDGPKTVGGILFDNANAYTISGPAAITLNNGVAAAGLTVNTGTQTISAPLIFVTSVNASTAAGTTLRLSGDITGAGGLIVSGSGTTILTGTNTYSSTTINGGTLQVGEFDVTGTLGTGDVTLAAGTLLSFNRTADLSVANAIFGADGQLTMGGAGTLTLSGPTPLARAVWAASPSPAAL